MNLILTIVPALITFFYLKNKDKKKNKNKNKITLSTQTTKQTNQQINQQVIQEPLQKSQDTGHSIDIKIQKPQKENSLLLVSSRTPLTKTTPTPKIESIQQSKKISANVQLMRDELKRKEKEAQQLLGERKLAKKNCPKAERMTQRRPELKVIER